MSAADARRQRRGQLDPSARAAPPATRCGAAPFARARRRRSEPLRAVARAALRAEARRALWHELVRTARGEPPLPAGPIERIAVVCLGNVCRSPFAAALLARAVPERDVRSFGLDAGSGRGADPRACALARRYGVDLSSHRTRPLYHAPALRPQLLLVMDAEQAARVARHWPAARGRIRLLGDYLPRRPFAIADPWAGDAALWQHTYERIELAVARLAARLREAR